MAERQAVVVNLDEFRRRRKAGTAATPLSLPPVPVMWMPVWVMVPVWSFR